MLGIMHVWLCTGEFLLVTAYITEMPLVRGRTAVMEQSKS